MSLTRYKLASSDRVQDALKQSETMGLEQMLVCIHQNWKLLLMMGDRSQGIGKLLHLSGALAIILCAFPKSLVELRTAQRSQFFSSLM